MYFCIIVHPSWGAWFGKHLQPAIVVKGDREMAISEGQEKVVAANT